MSNEKWTPGPWNAQPLKNGLEHEILSGEYYVAMTFGGCIGEGQPGSNANLIAAAPDLYELTKEAHDLIDGDLVGVEWKKACLEFIAKSASALAKARGEQS